MTPVIFRGDYPSTAISGTPKDFEALAFIAFSMFNDAYLSDLLLWKAGEVTSQRHNVWTARRIQLALITDRLSHAANLSTQLKRNSLYGGILRGMLKLLGINMYELNKADYEEIIATLHLSDQFTEQRDSFFYSYRIRSELSHISDDFIQYIESAKALLNDPKSTDSSAIIPQLVNRSHKSAFAILAMGITKYTEYTDQKEYILKSLSNGRPLLKFLYKFDLKTVKDIEESNHQDLQNPPDSRQDIFEFMSNGDNYFAGYRANNEMEKKINTEVEESRWARTGKKNGILDDRKRKNKSIKDKDESDENSH